MAVVLNLLWRTATSRIGIVVLIALALFAWHTLDKHSAVRRAVAEYVAGAELEAARAEADYERRQRRAAEQAKNEARKRAVLATRMAEDRAAEIDRLSAEAKQNSALTRPSAEDMQWLGSH